MKREPLNPRVKISPAGRPFVEQADLVASALKSASPDSVFTEQNQDQGEYKPPRGHYEAAKRAGVGNTEGRTYEEWCERVSDYGLDDAEQAFLSEQAHGRADSSQDKCEHANQDYSIMQHMEQCKDCGKQFDYSKVSSSSATPEDDDEVKCANVQCGHLRIYHWGGEHYCYGRECPCKTFIEAPAYSSQGGGEQDSYCTWEECPHCHAPASWEANTRICRNIDCPSTDEGGEQELAHQIAARIVRESGLGLTGHRRQMLEDKIESALAARYQPNQPAHAEVAALIDRLETIDDTVARGPWEASQPDHFPHKIKIDGFEFDCPAGSAQVRADESDIPTGCLIPHGIIHYDDAEGIAEMRNLIQPVIKVLRSISAPSAPADMKRLAREAAEKIRSIGFIDIQASERPTDTLATIIESVLTSLQNNNQEKS
jgi:hypothetical protein